MLDLETIAAMVAMFLKLIFSQNSLLLYGRTYILGNAITEHQRRPKDPTNLTIVAYVRVLGKNL